MSWIRDELYPLAKIGINFETCKDLVEKSCNCIPHIFTYLYNVFDFVHSWTSQAA